MNTYMPGSQNLAHHAAAAVGQGESPAWGRAVGCASSHAPWGSEGNCTHPALPTAAGLLPGSPGISVTPKNMFTSKC